MNAKTRDYHRLDFGKLTFSDTLISYEEALKNVTPVEIANDVSEKQIKITKAEKDYKNKCVKLEISY